MRGDPTRTTRSMYHPHRHRNDKPSNLKYHTIHTNKSIQLNLPILNIPIQYTTRHRPQRRHPTRPRPTRPSHPTGNGLRQLARSQARGEKTPTDRVTTRTPLYSVVGTFYFFVYSGIHIPLSREGLGFSLTDMRVSTDISKTGLASSLDSLLRGLRGFRLLSLFK